MAQPSVIVFDVNETLSDMTPLADRFAEVGLPAHHAPTWFAAVLRDGFALAVTGDAEGFAGIGAAGLRTLLHAAGREATDEAVAHVVAGMGELDLHPDVPDGLRALRAAGFRLVALTNGGVAYPEQLFRRAGVAGEFERLLTVADAGIWKPAAGAYAYAARECGVPLAETAMVAVHPWDLHGAARAGMTTVHIDRTGAPYPPFFAPPTHTVRGLDGLAPLLGAPARA